MKKSAANAKQNPPTTLDIPRPRHSTTRRFRIPDWMWLAIDDIAAGANLSAGELARGIIRQSLAVRGKAVAA